MTGPNPRRLSGSTGAMTSRTYPGGNAAAVTAARAANQYQFQLERASIVSAPVPDGAALRTLTEQVASNNFYGQESDARDRQVMEFLRRRIKHVIYVIKENRTFDQVLGDLTNGAKADPALAQFGAALTPNSHNLANQFVTLDNFMNPGRRQHGRLVVGPPGPRDDDRGDHAANQLRRREPRPLVRERRSEPQRPRELAHRGGARCRERTGRHDDLQPGRRRVCPAGR